MKMKYKILSLIGVLIAVILCAIPMHTKADVDTHTVTFTNVNSIKENLIKYKNRIGIDYLSGKVGFTDQSGNSVIPEDAFTSNNSLTITNLPNGNYYITIDEVDDYILKNITINDVEADFSTLTTDSEGNKVYNLALNNTMEENINIDIYFELYDTSNMGINTNLSYTIGNVIVDGIDVVNGQTIGEMYDSDNTQMGTIKIGNWDPDDSKKLNSLISFTGRNIFSFPIDIDTPILMAEVTESAGYEMNYLKLVHQNNEYSWSGYIRRGCYIEPKEGTTDVKNILLSATLQPLNYNYGYRMSVSMRQKREQNSITLLGINNINSTSAVIKNKENETIGTMEIKDANGDAINLSAPHLKESHNNNIVAGNYTITITPSAGYKMNYLEMEYELGINRYLQPICSNSVLLTTNSNNYPNDGNYTIDSNGVATYNFTIAENDIFAFDPKIVANSEKSREDINNFEIDGKMLLDQIIDVDNDGYGIIGNWDGDTIAKIKFYNNLGNLKNITKLNGNYYIDYEQEYNVEIIENEEYQLNYMSVFDKDYNNIIELDRSTFSINNNTLTNTINNIPPDNGYLTFTILKYKKQNNTLTINDLVDTSENYGVIGVDECYKKVFCYDSEYKGDIKLEKIIGVIPVTIDINEIFSNEYKTKINAGEYKITFIPRNGYQLNYFNININNNNKIIKRSDNSVIKEIDGSSNYTFTINNNDMVSIGTNIFDSTKPDTPTLKYKTSTYNSISMYWNSINNTSGYYIYRSTGGAYTKIGNTTGTSFTNYNLKTGQKYYYKVVAYKTIYPSDVLSNYSNFIKITPVLKKNSIKLYKSGSNKIKIKWTKINGASKYRIYRKISGGKWKRIKTVSSKTTSYKNTVIRGRKYYYKVRAYRTVSGKKIYSPYSKTKSKRR